MLHKDKGHPITGHESTGLEVYPYSFFNLEARWVGRFYPRSGRLTTRNDWVPSVG